MKMETIREFDPETQASRTTVESFVLVSRSELNLIPDGLHILQQKAEAAGKTLPTDCKTVAVIFLTLHRSVIFFSLLCDSVHLPDYLPQNVLIICVEPAALISQKTRLLSTAETCTTDVTSASCPRA
jgi:transcription-repair coupling factor (superfamily II helicase)